MNAVNTAILYALENSIFEFPDTPGLWETAIMQGGRKTSAPIAAKLGFKEVCGIDRYGWGAV